MLTGPNNFMYLTVMFSSILREYRQDQNVLKIAETGGKIHDQIVLLIEGLNKHNTISIKQMKVSIKYIIGLFLAAATRWTKLKN